MKPPKISPRRAAMLLLALGVGLIACSPAFLIDRFGGAFRHQPEAAAAGFSRPARELTAAALSDLEPGPIVDHHVHLIGLDRDRNGCYVNPALRSWRHPVRHFKFRVYASAAGIDDWPNADAQYVDRLLRLARGFEHPVALRLLAFDEHYRDGGKVDPKHTEFHTSNEYAFRVADTHPTQFQATMSIHPYRDDAIDELRHWAARGGRAIKWIPAAMGIDPSSPRAIEFYDEMARLGIVLLTHAGEEKAVEADALQRFGNPLLLRHPLDRGVTVIVAHCASLGDDIDLDDPSGRRVPSFDLFLRLLDDERYDGLLYGELSAVTLVNRFRNALGTLLERRDLHPRLVHGSDYPIPAVKALVKTKALAKAGFLTDEEARALDEIYDYNPLLCDYVLQRSVRHPETGQRFATSIFQRDPRPALRVPDARLATGERVHYERVEPSTKPPRGTIVWVHGWACDHTVFAEQLSSWSDTDQVIAIDLPGHGESEPPKDGEHSMALYAHAIEAVLNHAGVERAILVGHSNGAPAIREFYRMFPERTRALVVLDGPLRSFFPTPESAAGFIDRLSGNDYLDYIAPMVDGMLPNNITDERRAELRSMMFATPRSTMLESFRATLDVELYREDPIQVPLLVVNAASPYWDDDYEALVRRLNPNADYRVLDGRSHFLMVDDPNALQKTLRVFADGLRY